MKKAMLVSLVVLMPVLSGGCAIDALYWGLAGVATVTDFFQSNKPAPAPCADPKDVKSAAGTEASADRPARNRPGCQ
jgi:hypothetical protein